MGKLPEESRPFGVEPVAPAKVLQPNMEGWVRAGSVAECPEGSAIAVATTHMRIAIFHLADGWCAVKDACPHAEYPLSKGVLAGNEVTCASHGWRFRLPTGECLRGTPGVTLRTFPLEIRGGEIWVKVRNG
ncbi:MAG: Rieske (2Fe-2S) protein [Deltaproteobacteria bacterium]|nr:Rieske (2Fe-2S) protein [Deltaproteobacteria bacterium]